MGVSLPHVTSFCCCLGLEVGAKLVAWLHLLVSGAVLVYVSILADHAGKMAGTAEDVGDGIYSAAHRAAIILSLISAGHVVLAATLLYGVYKRNSAAIRVWAYCMLVLLVCGVAFNVMSSLLWGVNDSGSDMFLAFLLGTLFYGFVLYCIVAVNSYGLLLTSCQDVEGPYTNY